jgi:hypothetical protein
VCANNNTIKHLSRENLQFVLIDKADEIRDKMKKYGEVIEKNIEDNGFWLCKIYLVKELLASSFYLYNN